IRNTFRLSGRQHWDALKHDLRPIYTAPTEAAASAAFDDLGDRWGKQYPAIIRLWTNAWQEFIPFLDYDIEIRRVLFSTNAIESLNARYRRAVKARGHFLLVTWNHNGAERSWSLTVTELGGGLVDNEVGRQMA
uniref:transposase n=1 Tax=Rhodococcus qingshengii TaxID=334542 RepID=UPI002119C575